MKSISSLRGVIVTAIILVIGEKANLAVAKGSGGRCGVPEKCCTGRDSSCFVNKLILLLFFFIQKKKIQI